MPSKRELTVGVLNVTVFCTKRIFSVRFNIVNLILRKLDLI